MIDDIDFTLAVGLLRLTSRINLLSSWRLSLTFLGKNITSITIMYFNAHATAIACSLVFQTMTF